MTMNDSRSKLFRYLDYKKFLRTTLEELEELHGRGARGRFAHALGISPSFVTKLLARNSKAGLSPEHVQKASSHLDLDSLESAYFSELVSLDKAVTLDDRRFHKARLEEFRSRSLMITKPPAAVDITDGVGAALLAADWRYGAIFALVAIPGYQSAPEMARHLALTEQAVKTLASHMIGAGVLTATSTGYARAQQTLVLRSPFGRANGRNWRQFAIERSLDLRPQDLFKTVTLELSESEHLRLQALCLQLLDEAVQLADGRKTRKERVVQFNLDLLVV